MKPSKITILGNYWDCQIYRGRLYITCMDGSIKTIDWNKLVDSLLKEDKNNIAITYAFKNGRNLYHPELYELFADIDITNLLEQKFNLLSKQEIIFDEHQLNNFIVGQQESPFKELQVDSEIFNNKMFVLTHNCLLSSSVHGNTKYPVSTKFNKHFDLYGISMRANKYARIALSAGDEGLFEYNASSNEQLSMRNDKRMSQVSNNHSSFSDYSFLSIYNSSLCGKSFLSYFMWDEIQNESKPRKALVCEFSENEIFNSENCEIQPYLSWGFNEKIYRAMPNGIEIVRFNNYSKETGNIFSKSKFIPLQPWKGDVLAAFTSYFGTVLQCENAVVVMLSDGTFHNIPGAATKVRVYPRSLNYENHLHVILDDRIEIYSFNNDYFIDQKNKDFGVAFKMPKTFGYVRGGYVSKYEPDEKYYDFDYDKMSKPDGKDSDLYIEDLPF